MRRMNPEMKPLAAGLGVCFALGAPLFGIAMLIGVPGDAYFFLYLTCALIGTFVAVRLDKELHRTNR